MGDGYETIHSGISHFYGAPVTIQGVIALGQKARENGLPPLLVEDISLPRGGPMPGGHLSHQVGLDVDIALDMRSRGFSECGGSRVDPDRQSRAARWPRNRAVDVERGVVRVLWLTATLPGVDRLLVNAAIKQQLCRTVTSDRSWLRFVRPWSDHTAHMHIEFKCPEGQADCVVRAPPPPGDGCDATLQWWFDQLGAPKPPPGPAKPRPRLPYATRVIRYWVGPDSLEPGCNGPVVLAMN